MSDITTSSGAEVFREIVVRDIRGQATEAEARMLRLPANHGRWIEEITALRERIDAQIAERRAAYNAQLADCLKDRQGGRLRWADERAAYETWHAAALAFRQRVLVREREAKRIRTEHNRGRNEAEAASKRDARQSLLATLDDLRDRVEQLEKAQLQAGGRAA